VIVVDNGSADNPSRACKAEYPEVKMFWQAQILAFQQETTRE
jgi:hypothetical protein